MRIDLSVKNWLNIVCILVLLTISSLSISNTIFTEETNFGVEDNVGICLPYEGPGGCNWHPDPVFPGPGECAIIYSPRTDSRTSITFSLSEGSYSGLSIDPDNGDVTLCADEELFEQYSEISFTILLTDPVGNMIELSVTYSVPHYDLAPPIVNLSCDDIEENSGAGQVVCQVEVDDSGDISDGVSFSLTNDSDSALSIDAVTGVVVLTINPNYETQSEYSLTVIATDAAGNSAFGSGQFNIINIDESTPIEFSITSSANGYEAYGIVCYISLNSDDYCDTPGDINNQPAVYVASSTIVGSQKIVIIGYASDIPNTTGIGFSLIYDSSELSFIDALCEQTQFNIGCGDLIDSGTLHFAWASPFGQFPGANEVNLATLAFDIIGYEPPTQPQQVISVNNTPKGVLGRTSVLEVAYDTSDNNNQLSGLGMRVHFDSSLLSFKEITGLIEQDIIVDGQGPFSDDADSDNNPLTDQYMLFGWASLYNKWPNTELPAVLMNIAFDVSENIDTNVISSTNINFTDTSFTAGYEFSAESYQLDILRATWDFDGNGQADALTDGLMMLRYLFGLRDDLVTNGAMASNSPFDSQQVVAEIEAAMDITDIDADGELNALTDGLLLLRYLFALRDDSLTNGAVGPDATRSSNTDIQSYLDSHMPAM